MQGAALRHREFTELDAPLAKGLDLGGGGEGEDARDLLGGGELGVDSHGEPEILAHEHKLLRVFRVAHARNGVLGAQFVRNQTAEHVALVGRGGGHQKIGLGDAGLELDGVVDAVALDGDDVKSRVRVLELVGAVVDDHHVVPLGGELFGEGVAHLAVADDDNIHIITSK